MPHRIIKTIDGRRGAFLLLAGIMFWPTSLTYALSSANLNVLPGLQWLPDWADLWVLGAMLLVSSTFAIVIGLLSKKCSPELVGHGYAAAAIAPLIATAIGIVGLFSGEFQWFNGVVANVSLAGFIFLVSVWSNPIPFPEPPGSTSGPVTIVPEVR